MISKTKLQYNLQKHFDRWPSAWKENAMFADWLIRHVKPDVTLDLGVDWGHSTLCWASSNIGKVYGIDTWEPNNYSTVGHNMDEFINAFTSFKSKEIPNVRLIRKDHVVAEQKWNKQIDIIHFDILHDYDGVKKEYDLWKKHVRKDGVFLFHDLLSFPDGCGRFFREDLDQPRVSFNNQYGLGVMCEDESLIELIQSKFDVERL